MIKHENETSDRGILKPVNALEFRESLVLILPISPARTGSDIDSGVIVDSAGYALSLLENMWISLTGRRNESQFACACASQCMRALRGIRASLACGQGPLTCRTGGPRYSTSYHLLTLIHTSYHLPLTHSTASRFTLAGRKHDAFVCCCQRGPC